MLKSGDNNNFIMKELGRKIKTIRIGKSMTQQELAAKAGISFSTMVRLERGESIGMDNFISILRVLGYIQNIELLIPEQDAYDDIFNVRKKKMRVSKTKNNKSQTKNNWTWGDEG